LQNVLTFRAVWETGAYVWFVNICIIRYRNP